MVDPRTVRSLAPHEWRVYRDLRLHALTDSPDAFGRTLADEEGRPDTEWMSRLEKGADSRWDLPLVAEVGGEPVGLAWGRIVRSNPDVANLYQMWVAPGHRRLGVGRMLLDSVITWARARNASYLDLGVTCGDRPAMRLYARAGFRPVGAPQPLRPGSNLREQPMRLALRPGVALPDRIHIFGASGSGTTSLAAAIAGKHGHRRLDTDDFFWAPTNPPYREPRPREQRLALLRQALLGAAPWVLSGSLCGWGDPLIPEFDLVVFLDVPTPVRLARLRAREIARYGRPAIAVGGELHEAHVRFLEWAGRYDTGGLEMRSRALHEGWLGALTGTVVRLAGDRPVGEQLARIEASIAAGGVTRAADPAR